MGVLGYMRAIFMTAALALAMSTGTSHEIVHLVGSLASNLTLLTPPPNAVMASMSDWAKGLLPWIWTGVVVAAVVVVAVVTFDMFFVRVYVYSRAVFVRASLNARIVGRRGRRCKNV